MAKMHMKIVVSLLLVSLLAGCKANTALLSWEDNSHDEEGFRIYKVIGEDKTKIAEVGPNTTTYIDKDAADGSCYVVTAFNAAGESQPTGLVCISGSSRSVVAKPR